MQEWRIRIRKVHVLNIIPKHSISFKPHTSLAKYLLGYVTDCVQCPQVKRLLLRCSVGHWLRLNLRVSARGRQHTSLHLRQYLHLNRNKEGGSASNALVIVALDQRLYINYFCVCSVVCVRLARTGETHPSILETVSVWWGCGSKQSKDIFENNLAVHRLAIENYIRS